MPEVTVILPTCDRPLLVGRALDSLRAQTFTDFELLLVDGNRAGPPVGENPQLAQGRLERSIEGDGGIGQFCRCGFTVLRLRGAPEWRFALYALLARFRPAALKPDLPAFSHDS